MHTSIHTHAQFGSIVNAVEEGRVIYDNLKKTITYTLTHALPELFPIFLNLALSFPLGGWGVCAVCVRVCVCACVLVTVCARMCAHACVCVCVWVCTPVQHLPPTATHNSGLPSHSQLITHNSGSRLTTQ